MLDKDFYWCYNHENLFREWLTLIYFYADPDNSDLRFDKDRIFDLWQEAKKHALEIANSEQPRFLFDIMMYEYHTKKPYQYSLKKKFFTSMLTSTKNKKLESFANFGIETFRYYLNKNKIDEISIDELDEKSLVALRIAMLTCGQVKSNYDYSLPDGGIKEAITITDGTITKVITKTDETITDETQAETEEESVDVILPKYNALNNKTSIRAMRKAIEKGLIEIIEKGKYKWVGPKEVKGHYNSALAYWIAKSRNINMELNQKKSLTETSKNSIKNYFPPINDIKEVFGEEIKPQQLEDALERNKEQGWRKPIDEFFEDIYNFIGN